MKYKNAINVLPEYLLGQLQDFIVSQPTEITEFDEKLVKRLIRKITVFEDRFSVEFRSGVSLEVDG